MHAIDLGKTLVSSHFEESGNELTIGGQTASSLAEQFGTPLFVYDANAFRTQLAKLRAAVGKHVDVYFSVKANPNPAILRLFAGEGAGFEIASGAEFVRARTAGGKPSRILFAGPAKTKDELEYVIGEGIGEIHLESKEEIALVASIGNRLNRCVPVSVRINPVAAAQGGSMRMGGKPAQFGFDEEELPAILDDITVCPALDLKGIHLFAGTQILDANRLMAQWVHGIDLARRVSEQLGKPIRTVDLGGGLGIPYFSGEQDLDLDLLGQSAPQLFADALRRPEMQNAQFILEPGRFLAGPCGVYLCRVLTVKESRGSTFVIMDGGMHHHLAASGNLGQVIKKDYPIVLANKLTAPLESHSQIVVGPLCTPLDTIGRKADLPKVVAGDLVAVLQSGAYGLSASPVGFLSHPMPAEVLVEAGEAPRKIRPRGTFEQPITALP